MDYLVSDDAFWDMPDFPPDGSVPIDDELICPNCGSTDIVTSGPDLMCRDCGEIDKPSSFYPDEVYLDDDWDDEPDNIGIW